VDLPAGQVTITARAWDTTAAVQPEHPETVWNPKGHINNAWPTSPSAFTTSSPSPDGRRSWHREPAAAGEAIDFDGGAVPEDRAVPEDNAVSVDSSASGHADSEGADSGENAGSGEGADSEDGAGEHEPDYRFTLANERTFLAWIRSSLSLLAAGIAVVQLVPAFPLPGLRTGTGGLLVVLAVLCAANGVLRWQRVEQAMRRDRALPPQRVPWVLAIGLVVLALVGLVLVIVKGVAG
jgi:putative membrane protein